MTTYNPKPQPPAKPAEAGAKPGCRDEGVEHEFDSNCEIAENQGSALVIAVWCRHCGRSGSFIVDESDVNW